MAWPDVSSAGSDDQRLCHVFGCVYSCMCDPDEIRVDLCSDLCVGNLLSTEAQYVINLRDVSRGKSITQTIINKAEASQSREVFMLFKIIHNVAELPC